MILNNFYENTHFKKLAGTKQNLPFRAGKYLALLTLNWIYGRMIA